MKNLWNDKEAKKFGANPLAIRVYTSQLLGRETDLVLHGGGNTSVKIKERDLFGEEENILFIKGSGWDLATIQAKGFAPVRMEALLKMARLASLSDTDMVNGQRAAMIDPNAPNPSVEAILHAIIPFRYVDHTHADSVVAISNTPDGEKRIEEVYGDRVLVVPYVMPGFILAKYVYEMTKTIDWGKYEGIVFLHHGIFTFHDEAKKSYGNMIRLVSEAEKYLVRQKAVVTVKQAKPREDLKALASIRRSVSQLAGKPMIAQMNQNPKNLSFANMSNVKSMAVRGPLTPDHVIRTKPVPVILNRAFGKDIKNYAQGYKNYYNRYAKNGTVALDPAPRWGVWPNHGTITFGASLKDAQIATDIIDHTIKAIQQAEKLSAWKALPAKDIFEMEYWELEQAKLKKAGQSLSLQGKVALVTGAASGIGKACVESLQAQGACVVSIDIDSKVKGMFKKPEILELQANLTDLKQIKKCVEQTIRTFSGLDILVSNVGIFPPSEKISEMNPQMWQKSMDINLTSHTFLMKECVPYLVFGLDPTVVIIGSKNVPAPGPGVSAYSVAKAGLTQLARVSALELAAHGIRVNVLHPNQVFDTAIWTKEVLEKRAKHYGMSVEEYKTNNLLKTQITSKDVAEMVVTLAGKVFLKTTGAQIPIDGGNERVI